LTDNSADFGGCAAVKKVLDLADKHNATELQTRVSRADQRPAA